MSTINWDLLFERVLRAIAWCGDGRTVNMDADRVSGGKAGSRAPSLGASLKEDPHPLYELPKKYAAATDDKARRVVVQEAVDTLRQFKYAPDRALQRGTLEWREKIAHDGRGSRTVAALYELDWRTVLKFRREFGVVVHRSEGG